MTAWRFDNSYKSLSPALFAPVAPTPVADPRLVVLNRPLAKTLGLEIEAGQEAQWAAIFAGNAVPEGDRRFRIVDCGFRIDPNCRLSSNPQSQIRNPQFFP